MKAAKLRIASALVVVLSLVGVTGLALAATPAFEGTVHAQALKEAQEGAESTGKSSGSIPGLAKSIINILSWIVGVAAVVMIVIGGLKYVTSNGDSGNIASAKNTIIYAIVGLVVAIFAQAIVRFVIGKI